MSVSSPQSIPRVHFITVTSAAVVLFISGCRDSDRAPIPKVPSKEPLQVSRFEPPDPSAGLRSFDEIIKLPEHQFDVAEAVLSLSSELAPSATPEVAKRTLEEIDRLAARAKEDLPENPDAIDYFDTLYEVVLDRKTADPFREDRPENYDLSLAVSKRRGSCLSVGIMTLAVTRRMGAPIHGVQCPAHFFLKYTPPAGAKAAAAEALNFDVTRPSPENWKKFDDNFYRRWHQIDSRAESAGAYLRPLTDREVVSAYLSSRSGYFASRKDFTAALLDAERALALNPRNVTAQINAGFSAESLQKYQAAHDFYAKALQIDPRSIRALNNLAYLKVRDSQSSFFDIKGAEHLIGSALKQQPDKAFLLATCGEVKAARKDWRGAGRCLQDAMKLEPKNAAYRQRFMYFREQLRGGE